MTRKRPSKAAKVSAKGKAALAEVQPKGGASAPTAGHSEAEIRRRVYNSALADAETLAEAERGLKKLKSRRIGVEAARIDLAEQEAGTDIAAEIAEKVFPYPKKKSSKDPKAVARFQLSQSLEDLGWWLAEVPPGGKKARWRAILPGNFNDEDRYSSDERSATRWTLAMTSAINLIEDIAARLKSEQGESDRIPLILEILETNREAVRAFLERFFQRGAGNRAVTLWRRQQTAEALSHGKKPPKADEKKAQENDIAWIRKRVRRLFPNSKIEEEEIAAHFRNQGANPPP